MSAQHQCGYCDETDPGVIPYQQGQSLGFFHPSCMDEMKTNGPCGGEEDGDEEFGPTPLMKGGNA